MFNYTYEELLNRAIKNLPEKVKGDVRFEYPKIDCTIEGSKTVIYNLREIAKKLGRNPKDIYKFLLKELGTYGIFEDKRVIFTGRFSKFVLNEKLSKYINEYVICPECGKPDTVLIKEKGVLIIKCMACGARRTVPEV